VTLDFFESFFVIFILFGSSRFSARRFKGSNFFLEIGIGGLIDGKDGFQILIGLVYNNMSDRESKDSPSLFPVDITTQCTGAGDFAVI
jgi:hypothetical protein